MWKYLFAVLMIMHGLAHITGPLGFWTSGSQAFADRPWLFSAGITPHSIQGQVFGLLWLAAGIAFVGVGLGLLLGLEWWSTLALAAAVVSLVAIVPWVRVVPPGAWAGACLDLAVFTVLLLPWGNRFVALLS